MMTQTGHILTAHNTDDKSGMRTTYYGSTGETNFKLIFTDQRPTFFIEEGVEFNPSHIQFDRKPSKLKSFSNKTVDIIYLNFYKDLRLVKDYCKTKGTRTFELDINPSERFLMERFIHSQIEFQGEPSQTKNNIISYMNPQIRPATSSLKFSSLSLDIETGVEGDLFSIALYQKKGNLTKKIVLMMDTENHEESSEELIFFLTEKSLLENFLQLIQKWDPDFIIGWHVIGFDFTFLEKKCLKWGMQLSIGRENSPLKIDERPGMGFSAQMKGRIVIDGPPTLRAAFYKFKNFKLDTVATEVLGFGKDISSDSEKVAEIERRFKDDKKALAKYNLLDCTLVTDIYEKLDIFNLLIERTKISGLLFDRLAVSTAAFDHVFLPRLHRKGFVAPNRIDIEREDSSSGGMVLEPIEGRHYNIAVLDFKSLYPTIIQTFKIDPLSKVRHEVNPVQTPNGTIFSKTEHILPEVITGLLKKREEAKSYNNQALSMAIKILMNSFYGIMGSSRSRFYHADLPEAITTTGHWILKKSITFFKEQGHETIYGDTDSLFIKMNNNDDESSCHKLAKRLSQFLNKTIEDEFSVPSYLECEFEILYEQIFFGRTRGGDRGAKKKYVGQIGNKELHFKGMEFVRSDWTQLAKNFQKEIFIKYFNNEPIEEFIKEYISTLESGIFDEDLTYTKRLSKAPEDYVKNIPVHVKAALLIDHKGPYRLKEVSYVITHQGPRPIQHNPRNFDYPHYIEKQLKPIADDILVTQNKSFDAFILGDQLAFDI